MKLTQYIINDIGLQPISQTVGAFKAIFKEFTYTHLPVSENGVYIGLIAENDLRCFDETKSLIDYRYAIENGSSWLHASAIDSHSRPMMQASCNEAGMQSMIDAIPCMAP